MANLDSKLTIAEADFDQIKSNLKAFLNAQTEFTDYDFEGSALANLIDLLAYNTHYMTFYMNMLANESFLDTASMRDAVISHAQMLGYTPNSMKSSIAKINLMFTMANNSAVADTTTLTLPKMTHFSSSAIDGVNYSFYNLQEITVNRTSGDRFIFPNVNIVEGTPVNYVYVYDMKSNPTQEFILPDNSVDVSTIEVVVQSSSQDTTQVTYKQATSFTVVEMNSPVFYVSQTKDTSYKIYFGDDLLGKSLSDGNVIIISYLLSKGTASNKAAEFTLLDAVGGMTVPSIEVTQAAAGGSLAESIESIKFTAPKSFVSNNRAVTKNDFISLIKKNYPALSAVNVWGGEENNPPVYGKVYISAKPAVGYTLSMTEKDYVLREVISPMSIVTVTPEFVDPDYSYLNLELDVTYDPAATTKTPGEMETSVRGSIYAFANTYLNNFNSYFKTSRLTREIDNSETSIQSSDFTVKIEKRLNPYLAIARSYIIDFHTELKRSSGKNRIISTPAYVSYDEDFIKREFYLEETPLSFTGIASVDIILKGSNIVNTPVIKITGDGIGATAEAVIVNGKVSEVKIINPGVDYSTATIKVFDSVTEEEITSVYLEPVIENRYGTLRSYYYTSNKIKVIHDLNAATVDYKTGTITLKNFYPLDISNDTKTIKFIASPQTNIFYSTKNSIITIDQEDPASLSITTSQIK